MEGVTESEYKKDERIAILIYEAKLTEKEALQEYDKQINPEKYVVQEKLF